MNEIAATFTCEHDDVPCRAYMVTGRVTRCIYCDDCAALAEIDWNGETASCIAVTDDESDKSKAEYEVDYRARESRMHQATRKAGW